MYYGKKRNLVRKKNVLYIIILQLKTLRSTDTIRALVKEAEDITINCSCTRFFYKQLNC